MYTLIKSIKRDFSYFLKSLQTRAAIDTLYCCPQDHEASRLQICIQVRIQVQNGSQDYCNSSLISALGARQLASFRWIKILQ